VNDYFASELQGTAETNSGSKKRSFSEMNAITQDSSSYNDDFMTMNKRQKVVDLPQGVELYVPDEYMSSKTTEVDTMDILNALEHTQPVSAHVLHNEVNPNIDVGEYISQVGGISDNYPSFLADDALQFPDDNQ
jgi:hypothetical protein